MTRHYLITLISTAIISCFTYGCSGDDDYIFEHGPAGPNTKKTLKPLPEGLRPDTAKAHHTDETLANE